MTQIALVMWLRAMENRKTDSSKAEIMISKKIRDLHPVVEHIVNNLAAIEPIRFIRISPDFIQASSEATQGRVKNPITKPGHPSAIGLSLIVDYAYQDIHFFEMNSPIRGYGGMMVEAVLRDLPNGWKGVVVMDWSDGFWDKMKMKYSNLMVS